MNILKNIVFQLFHLPFSQTAKNTYLVFIGNLLAMFFGFIFIILLVRLLSLSDFGYFSSVFTFLIIVSEFSDIGIGNSLSRFLPLLENKQKELFSFIKSAFIVQIFIAFLVFSIIFFFSNFLSKLFFRTSELDFLFKITSFGIWSAIMANFFQYVLSARQKFFQVAILVSFAGLLRIVLLFLLIYLSAVNLTNVVWIQMIAYFLYMIFAFIFVGKKFLMGKKEKKYIWELLQFSWYLGIARSLTSIASRLDVLMLVAITNASEAGIYSTASRIIAFYPLLTGSFTSVIAPRITRITKKEELQKFTLKIIFGTAGLVASIIFLIVFSVPFLGLLFAEKGVLAVSVFRLLLLSMIFFVASIPAVSVAVYYLRKPQILTVNSILQLLIVIVGNLLFIPQFGRHGPAYSLILAYGITLFFTIYLTLYFFKKNFRIN